MSFAISTGTLQRGVSYVGITVYGTDAAELGAAAGAIYAAADAALLIDPYGEVNWSYLTRRTNWALIEGEFHQLTFKASCDDVLEDGPIHLARQLACKNAMYDQLYKLLQRYG